MVLKWGVDTPGDPSNEGDGFDTPLRAMDMPKIFRIKLANFQR